MKVCRVFPPVGFSDPCQLPGVDPPVFGVSDLIKAGLRVTEPCLHDSFSNVAFTASLSEDICGRDEDVFGERFSVFIAGDEIEVDLSEC